jgi:hypothetical protein
MNSPGKKAYQRGRENVQMVSRNLTLDEYYQELCHRAKASLDQEPNEFAF